MLLGAVLLCGVYFFPIWQITLEAPQFPEGLQMNIWINKFSGSTENIIQDINILNHYIGMQMIEPDSIAELKYFPYVVAAMVVYGIIALIIDNRFFYLSWVIILLILSLLGVYDFYLWLYDYGHNLSPEAPIKVPGMTYMPPVFGEKDLLNFYVKSYPMLGTIFMSIGLICGGVATLIKFKEQ
jgi:copper chaperone NosL